MEKIVSFVSVKRYKIMQFDEINEKLERGDKALIARMTGCHPKTVEKIFSGDRSQETPTAERIKTAAEKVITNRLSLLQ